ncbi:MAG: GTP-binding protein, partial [Pseudomonadota bacterium]
MEPIIAVVGFLGAGKTTLLRHLISRYIDAGWKPFVILNDYENAYLDVQQLSEKIEPQWLKPLNGSCICCSGITELRDSVNRIPAREKGITLVEANGTSDACALMGFLGVGINERFLPPVQVSVVDVKNWQKRGENNELEANQLQVASLIILTHLSGVSDDRYSLVMKELERLNPSANIITTEELDISMLPALTPSQNEAQKLDHQKAHWASCSTDLPVLPDRVCIEYICDNLPKSILRVKGCVSVGDEDGYTYFERTPNGEFYIRPFYGAPVTGTKLLTVGPGSDITLLDKVIADSLDLVESH